MNVLRIAIKEIRRIGVITAGMLVIQFLLPLLSKLVSATAVYVCIVALSGAYIISALLAAERYEERNNGYLFLLRMPVRAEEVAAGKLLLMYLLNIVGCIVVLLLAGMLGQDSRFISIARSVALLLGCCWLILILLMYSGICILGFTKFVFVFRIAVLSLLVALQAAGVLALRLRADIPLRLQSIGNTINQVPWLVVCAAVSAVYFGYIAVAGRLVRNHAAR
jgi:hypothetical protein